MIFANEAYKNPTMPKEYLEGYIKMVYPFAPHLGEELWNYIGHTNTITYESWPTFEEHKTINQEITVVVQVMVNCVINYKLLLILQKKNLKDWH